MCQVMSIDIRIRLLWSKPVDPARKPFHCGMLPPPATCCQTAHFYAWAHSHRLGHYAQQETHPLLALQVQGRSRLNSNRIQQLRPSIPRGNLIPKNSPGQIPLTRATVHECGLNRKIGPMDRTPKNQAAARPRPTRCASAASRMQRFAKYIPIRVPSSSLAVSSRSGARIGSEGLCRSTMQEPTNTVNLRKVS